MRRFLARRAARARIPRTPTVLQMEAVECGAAALGILLAHHGRHVPLAELREACGVSRDGSNAANVVKAARRYGMKAKGLSTSLDDVRKLEGPFIVFWHFNHFVVVEGFHEQRVWLNDPASGRRTVPFDEFDEGFTGVVLLVEPGPEFLPGGRRDSTVLALRERLGGSGRDLVFCIAAGLLLVAPGLAVPMFTQVFVDEVLLAGRHHWVRPLLLGFALMAALQIALYVLQLRYLRELRVKLALRLSSSFLWHVLRLPANFFDQRYAGEISSRLALNGEIAGALSGRLAMAAIDSLMVVFYLAIMLAYDRVLTAIGVALSLGNVLALRLIARKRVDASLRLRQDAGKVAGVAIAGLQSMETIKASALESSFFARWAGHYTKSVMARQELGLTNQMLGVVPGTLGSMTTLAILVIGGLRVISGDLSIGSLVAFQSLMLMFQRPVGSLVNLAGVLQTLQGDVARVDDVMRHAHDPETERADAVAVPPTTIARLAGRVELRGVTFGYSRVAPPLIEKLDLVIEPGRRLALIGGSGSGKSTIARLVCGLYQPWEGEILFDGKPRARIDRRVLAQSLSFVDQEILFFGGTVVENLTLWDASVPRSHLDAACLDAAIHDVVIGLPGGYEGHLAEGGSNLSGGQRQRLEIARALVNRPSILVLDEATSALDAETEFAIDRSLRLLGCTTLVVAHRLSTIRDADEILVLQRGKVLERGTHEQLWTLGGEYHRLIRSEGGALEA